MTRADVIQELSKVLGLSKWEADAVVCTIFESMTVAFVKGDKVELRGFGGFTIRHRRPRVGRNPTKTGTSVEAPERCVPFFKVGNELRNTVNKLSEEHQSETA